MPRTPRLDEVAAIGTDGAVRVVVECPRASNVKLKYDAELGAMRFVRPLPFGIVFPFDFGFVPATRAEDGDPLDAMIVLDRATSPGVVVDCRAIAVLRASQKGARGRRVRNDRVVCVAEHDRAKKAWKDLADVAPRLREELEGFFAAAVAFEGKDLELLGWGGEEQARAAIAAAAKAEKAARRSGG